MAHQIESSAFYEPVEVTSLTERRSKRTALMFSKSTRARMNEVAATFDVSANEVLIACLQFGLSNPAVLELVREAMKGPERLTTREETKKSEHLLPRSLREHLEAIRTRFEAPSRRLTQIATICVQSGLGDAKLLQDIRERAATRTKKLGRTVSKEAIHRAA
jgi:hypothetical protein